MLFRSLRSRKANVGVTLLSPAFSPTRISEAQRNRPAELAETVPITDELKQRIEAGKQVVQQGRQSAAEIAEQTLQAVEANRFYVFPHRRVRTYVEDRAATVLEETEAYDWMRHTAR